MRKMKKEEFKHQRVSWISVLQRDSASVQQNCKQKSYERTQWK